VADDIVYKMVRLRDANPTINPGWMALDRWLAEVAKAHGDLDRLVRTDIFDLENNYSGDFINITEEEYNSMDIISGIIIDRPTWDAFLTSINSYADVPVHWPNETSVEKTNWPCEKLGTKSLYFTATEEDLLVTILGSLDGGLTFPITAESEFAVDVGSPVLKPISNFYHALKIQVKPAVDDAHGTLKVSGGGTSIPGMSDVEVTALLDKTGLATQTTLAAILAKLITAPSTEAKQDTIKTAIDAITTKLSADPATQTTLAAILAKLIAAPATEAGQQPPATTVTHDSIALTAANTEYSLVIPTGCKKLTFRTVQADGKTPGDDLLYAFVTGKVDHPTLYEHMLLDGGAVYSESNLSLSSKTLYVAGITAGDIVLLEMWS